MGNPLEHMGYASLRPFEGKFGTGIPVLVFHKLGSLPKGVRMKSLYVGEGLFAWQIREIAQSGFATASLDSWREFSSPNEPRRVVLTFDDGSRTVLRHALPVLAEHRMSAIQYLVADALGGVNHWDVREHGEAPDALMDAAEVRDWLAAGHEIGAHTLTHPRLTEIPVERAREEIFASKKKLEDLFGRPIRHFCYPYGKWSRAVRDLVEEAGYETAVTLKFGVNAGVRDPFALRRVGARHPSRKLRHVVKLLSCGFPPAYFWQR